MSYYKWNKSLDVPLYLELIRNDGVGLTGSDPQVMIRRVRNTDNNSLLDSYYWDGSGFTATPTSASMSQVDATNQPGLYVYTFSQSLVQSGTMYSVTYHHNADPLGFTSERHYFLTTASGSDLGVTLYESEVD